MKSHHVLKAAQWFSFRIQKEIMATEKRFVLEGDGFRLRDRVIDMIAALPVHETIREQRRLGSFDLHVRGGFDRAFGCKYFNIRNERGEEMALLHHQRGRAKRVVGDHVIWLGTEVRCENKIQRFVFRVFPAVGNKRIGGEQAIQFDCAGRAIGHEDLHEGIIRAQRDDFDEQMIFMAGDQKHDRALLVARDDFRLGKSKRQGLSVAFERRLRPQTIAAFEQQMPLGIFREIRLLIISLAIFEENFYAAVGQFDQPTLGLIKHSECRWRGGFHLNPLFC